VLLGEGDGTFPAHVTYAAGGWPHAVRIGDLNRDGKPDLVTANSDGLRCLDPPCDHDTADSVSVFLGKGDGTFPAHVDYASTWDQGTGDVQIADVNRDGKPDVVAANAAAHSVSVLLGKGDGTLRRKVDYATGNNASNAVQIGDLDRDGKADLVTANAGHGVSVLLGKGDGTFPTLEDYETGRWPYAVQVGDLNRDGKPDLVSANYRDSTVSVLLNISSEQPAFIGATDANLK